MIICPRDLFIFDTIGSFCGVLTTFFVGGTVVWLFIGVDAPAMFSFLMPSDRVMEFDDFLLEELRLVVYLELVIVGPFEEGCVCSLYGPAMVLR